MSHKIRDIGDSHQIGKYSDAVEVPQNLRWLFTSGTPALEILGTLPADITGQIELAWKHILSVLEQANMDLTDVVTVTQCLTRAEDIVAYAKVRTHFPVMLSQHRCSWSRTATCATRVPGRGRGHRRHRALMRHQATTEIESS